MAKMSAEQWRQKIQQIQDRLKKKDEEARASLMNPKGGDSYASRVAERAGVKITPEKDALKHVEGGGTFSAPLSDATRNTLVKWQKKFNSKTGRASARKWLNDIIKENPSERLKIYDWLEANEKNGLGEDFFKSVATARATAKAAEAGAYETLQEIKRERQEGNDDVSEEDDLNSSIDTMLASDDWKQSAQMAKEVQEKNDALYAQQRKRDEEASAKHWRDIEQANAEALARNANLPDLDTSESIEELKKTYGDHAGRLASLADAAKKYGFKGDLIGKADKAYNEAYKKHGDAEKAYSEIENNMLSKANKRVMARRGEQMTAEQKAREEAIRNNPQAAQRREALAREWGKPQVSFAQAEAKARWAAKDNADRYGRRNNIGAAMDAYVGSSRHGFDTVANLGGNGRPVNLSLPKGSAADNYMRAYEFNQGSIKAQQDMQKAKIQQERNLANQATTLVNVTPPNASPEVKANNVAAMGKAGASPKQPQPIRGY